MTRHVLSPEAQQDLYSIQRYLIAEAGVGVARRVMRAIEGASRFLAVTPGARHSRQDLTDQPVKFWRMFSYMIVYDPLARPIGIACVEWQPGHRGFALQNGPQ